MRKVSRRLVLTFLIAAAAPGCTSLRLQHSITSQATTLSDLHYQQVLNNLAMFAANPYAMPAHVAIRDGSAQIQDFGQATSGLDIAGAVKTSLGLTGSRTVVEQWGVSPVTDDIEVRIIQVAYQRALGWPVVMDYDTANDLARELCKQTAETSDIDQRNDFLGTENFREEFARLFAQQQFPDFEGAQSSEKKLAVLETTRDRSLLIDVLIQSKFLSSNSAEIILKEEEYDPDPSLSKLRPEAYNPRFYARDPNQLPRSAEEAAQQNELIRYCTALALNARQEVKDTQDDLLHINPGWFGTGTKHDVPHDACYVGRYKDRYAWVCAYGLRDLTQFTIAILKFSDLIKERTVLTVPGGPRFTPAGGR
jgi:hypothetical protein